MRCSRSDEEIGEKTAMNVSIIICENRKDLDEKRNTFKKYAKEKGIFLKVERDTVICRNQAVTFVVEEIEIDDEHLPDTAFKEE